MRAVSESPSTKPKSNEYLPTAEVTCTPSSVKVMWRIPLVSEHATQRLPSRASMMPEGWANQASAAVSARAFDAGACEDADGAVDGFVAEELVGACHGDDELVGFAGVDRIPGRGERNLGGGYAGGDVVGVAGDGVVTVDDALHAVTCEGAYFAGAQVEGAQAVVDGVGDEHVVAELCAQVFGYEGDTGGLVEACFGAGAVDVVLDGVVDGVVAAAVGVDDGVEVGCYLQDAVACAVCDEVGAFAVAEEVCVPNSAGSSMALPGKA